MIRRNISISALLCVLLVMSACPQVGPGVKVATQTAVAVHEAWPLVQKAFATAYDKKAITEAQWKQFVELDKKVLATQNALVDALKLYQAARSVGIESKDDLVKIVLLQNELQALYQQAIKLAGTFGVRVGGVQ